MPTSAETIPYDNTVQRWYVMRPTYGRTSLAEKQLTDRAVTHYVPKRWHITTAPTGKRLKKLVPLVNNMIFLFVSWDVLMALKHEMSWMQIATHRQQGRNTPIIVPEKQMQDFIRLTRQNDDSLKYLSPEEAELANGKTIRIIGGPFDGVEGQLLSTRGRGKKRLQLSIVDLLVVTIEISNYDFVVTEGL